MEAQDQLERKYICKKDEHRALEMQNYMGLCRNTGIFDPNRFNNLYFCNCDNVSLSNFCNFILCEYACVCLLYMCAD